MNLLADSRVEPVARFIKTSPVSQAKRQLRIITSRSTGRTTVWPLTPNELIRAGNERWYSAILYMAS